LSAIMLGASIPNPYIWWVQLAPSENRGGVLLRVCAKLLSPQAQFLAQNAPQTVWWSSSAGFGRGKELVLDFDSSII